MTEFQMFLLTVVVLAVPAAAHVIYRYRSAP